MSQTYQVSTEQSQIPPEQRSCLGRCKLRKCLQLERQYRLCTTTTLDLHLNIDQPEG